ncbi:unnamed protein product [Phytophthora fragariaefolia]|uniref:Unnamed protein product n=1 Tax=Phytophthora fragariaefolia TaxID=1490495 RepID=A0A9W6TTG4_9STRA|nr:unnamed protein product [Phytophthora fragariaefolia]
MSALDIEWHLPTTPDGPTPVQLLIEWFALNGVVYHASAHQREVLRPLCDELNARGVRCEADQVLDYVSYLQEVVQDAASSGQPLPEPLRPIREQLQQLLFKDGRLEDDAALLQPRARPSSRLSWLKPSAIGGPSAMEVLVEWLRENYSAYARATRKGGKGRMLEQLVDVIKQAGHVDCAVNTVRSKIDVLQREVRGEKTRSTAFEQFGAVLEEIFTVGDAADEDLKHEDDDLPDRDLLCGDQENRLPPIQSNLAGAADTKLSLAEKIARSSPTSRLSWMKPTAAGGPCAMELLVEWLVDHYADYTHSAKKGDKGRMLAKLLHQIEASGHRGCTIHAIRVKIDSLQRQMEGKSRPSAAFDLYGETLSKVFAGKAADFAGRSQSRKDRLALRTQTAASPRVPDEKQEEDVVSPLKSDEEQEDCEMNTGSFLTTNEENPVKFVLEPAESSNVENHDDADGNANESYKNSPSHSPNPFDSDAEEDTRMETRIDLTKVNSIPKEVQPRVTPVNSPSTNEIVRIATLLRERHDLLQRGVPQDQIDKFLPLPEV